MDKRIRYTLIILLAFTSVTVAGQLLMLVCHTGLPTDTGTGTGTGTGTDTSTDLSTTTETNEVNQYGIKWTFDKAYTVGQFDNNDYFVIGPVNIIDINPKSIVQGDDRTINGTMVNIHSGDLKNGHLNYHGFDSYLSVDPPYDVSYNKGRPNGNDISAQNYLHVDINSSVVSVSSRIATLAELANFWGDKSANPMAMPIQTATVLTVLPTVPKAYSFRPGYCGDDKVPHYTVNDINYNAIKSAFNITMGDTVPLLQGTGAHSAGDANYQSDTYERMVERLWLDFAGGNGDVIRPGANMMADGGAVAGQVSRIALILNSSNFTNAQKKKLLIGFIQVGIDYYSVHQGANIYGYSWKANGQGFAGKKFPILFAGMALNDANMKAISDYGVEGPGYGGTGYISFAEDEQTFYVSQWDIDHFNPNGVPAARDTVNGASVVTYYTSANLGMPEWGHNHCDYPNSDNYTWGNGSPYRITNANEWGGFILAAHVMGLKTLWKHNSLFDYMDRYMLISSNTQNGYISGPTWATYRGNHTLIPDCNWYAADLNSAGSCQ